MGYIIVNLTSPSAGLFKVAGIEILDIIHQDEIKHVSYGDKWYKYVCNMRKLDPTATFFKLCQEYNAQKIRGAFNRNARLTAGFSEAQVAWLASYKEQNI